MIGTIPYPQSHELPKTPKILVVDDSPHKEYSLPKTILNHSRTDSPGVSLPAPEPFAPESVLKFTTHGLGNEFFMPTGPRVFDNSKKEVKHCLNCNSPHTHNNAYCSAACCKEHRAVKKGNSI